MSLHRGIQLTGDIPAAPEPEVPADWPHSAPPPVSPWSRGMAMVTSSPPNYGSTSPETLWHPNVMFATTGDY